MHPSLRLVALLFFVSASLVCGQAKSPDPEVQENLDGLKTAVKKKVEPDQIHYIKKLAEKWAAADVKQRKAIHKLAASNLKSKSADVKEATIEALSVMKGGKKDKDGANATKILVGESKKKPTEKDPTYFGRVLVAIGKVGHKKGMPVLVKLLKYKDYDVRGSAVEALAHYKDASLSTKKEIVESILKMYTSVWNQAKDPRAVHMKRRLEKVNRPSETTLKILTGAQGVVGADNWWKWWNENKKAKAW